MREGGDEVWVDIYKIKFMLTLKLLLKNMVTKGYVTFLTGKLNTRLMLSETKETLCCFLAPCSIHFLLVFMMPKNFF